VTSKCETGFLHTRVIEHTVHAFGSSDDLHDRAEPRLAKHVRDRDTTLDPHAS